MSTPQKQELQPTALFHPPRHTIIRLFMLLADEPKFVSSKRLAEQMKMSHASLRKVTSFLNGHKDLTVGFGPQGGYMLANPPNEISLLDMVGFSINPDYDAHGMYELAINICEHYDTIYLSDILDWDE